MKLRDFIERTLDGRRGLSSQELKGSRPLRNPAVVWSEEPDGSAVLEAPLAQAARRWERLMAKWSKEPITRKFELEPVGAFVWRHCDGQHSYEAIAKKLRTRYKMGRLEAEASLSAFLQMLSQRRLITLMVGTKK